MLKSGWYGLFLLLLLFSCKKKPESISPKVADITESVYATGTVKTQNQYQVYSTVNGIIQAMLVKEGDTIKKSDPLFKVLNETAQLNTENAQLAADYATVQANADKLAELKVTIDLAKSKRDNDQLLLQRQQKLWAQNIGSRNELEQRELAFANASNNYQATLLRYNELKRQLEFADKQSKKNVAISRSISKDFTIRSERNGKVYQILKEQGEMVNTQSPVAIIGDASAFLIDMQVDEYDIAQIRLQQQVVLRFDSYKGQIFEARVTRIYPIMNEKTRSFTVEASFVTRPDALYPNLSAEANIILQEKKKVLLIPRAYLVDDQFVLGKNKEKRKVQTGLKDYQQVEILSGLSTADVIYMPEK